MTSLDVSIVLYGYERDDFLRTLLALKESRNSIRCLRILLSGDQEELSALQESISSADMSHVTVIDHRYDNLGFASGHNRLLQQAFDAGADACLVLNPDVVFSQAALERFVGLGNKNKAALVGPTLARLDPTSTTHRPAVADSLGIGWSKTARHFDQGQGQPWIEPDGSVRVVPGVTGACLLVSRDSFRTILDRTGYFFDDFFLAYREDAELGVRAASVGVESRLLSVEGFAHVRSTRGFTRTNDFVNMLGVRNRFLMKFVLGKLRPGNRVLASMRDVVVVGATFSIERTSIIGLLDAWRVRRFQRAVGRHLRNTSTTTELSNPLISRS